MFIPKRRANELNERLRLCEDDVVRSGFPVLMTVGFVRST